MKLKWSQLIDSGLNTTHAARWAKYFLTLSTLRFVVIHRHHLISHAGEQLYYNIPTAISAAASSPSQRGRALQSAPLVSDSKVRAWTGRLADVLFSGVGELVLSPAVVGLLDARVSPQRLYRADVRLVKRGDLLHLHLAHQLGVILSSRRERGARCQHRQVVSVPSSNGTGVKARAHLVLLILEGDFQGLGCTDHGLH